MEDLIDRPLSADEIEALPERLCRRYWAAEIGRGVVGFTSLDSATVRHECRSWLAWVRDLKVGDRARYLGIAYGYNGLVGTIAESGNGSVGIRFSQFEDTFSVALVDLAQP